MDRKNFMCLGIMSMLLFTSCGRPSTYCTDQTVLSQLTGGEETAEVVLDGISLVFPAPLEKLTDAGWEVVLPNQYEEMTEADILLSPGEYIRIGLWKDGSALEVKTANLTEDVLALGEGCSITELNVKSESLAKDVDENFAVSKFGIRLGTSQEDVSAAFSEADRDTFLKLTDTGIWKDTSGESTIYFYGEKKVEDMFFLVQEERESRPFELKEQDTANLPAACENEQMTVPPVS